jgi:hypothetical protein
MSHAYTLACVGVPDDRAPYVEPHADAVEVIEVLETLGDKRVYGGIEGEFLFRELMLGLILIYSKRWPRYERAAAKGSTDSNSWTSLLNLVEERA